MAEIAIKNDIRVLYSSTSEVFGRNPKIPWDEDDERVVGSTKVDRWSYSTSKSLCEHMMFALSSDNRLRCSIVRFFNVYGPRQNPIFVVSRGVQRAINGQGPLQYDSGEQNRCFTYIDDAIEGMIIASEKREALGEAFNIGNNIPTKIKEVNRIIIEQSGNDDLEVINIETADLYGDKYEDIGVRVPQNSKAKKILGWTPRTQIYEGISKTVQWAKENPEWLAIGSE